MSTAWSCTETELPHLFDHLLRGEELDVADAAADRRTAEFERVVMRPLGTRSLFVVPVKRAESGGRRGGAGRCAGPAAARDFVRAVAHMVALRIAEAPAEAPAGNSCP